MVHAAGRRLRHHGRAERRQLEEQVQHHHVPQRNVQHICHALRPGPCARRLQLK